MKKTMLFILMLCLAAPVFTQEGQDGKEKRTMKPALLVVDVQKQYLPMMSAEDQEKAIEYLNYAIYLFRKFNQPVIRIYHTSNEWGPEPGSDAFQFHDSLNVSEDDPMVIKNYANAFIKTDLEKILNEMEVNTLFICGLSSVGCVMATYWGAEAYDYEVFLVKDALLGPKVKYTELIEEIYGALDLNAINFMLEISQ
nr:isochorismatase family protein [Bacteroidota bacterium]